MTTLESTSPAGTRQAPLAGKVALVTGGGRGLGEATSEMLARHGASVVIGDFRHELAKRVADRLSRGGGKHLALPLDVGDPQQVDATVRAAIETFGRLDILVNNAGTDVTLPIDELSVEEIDRVLATNLRGPFLLSRAAFIQMKRQGGGHVVNIVSTAAKRAWANASVYHASKWGLLGLSHALHVEGREHDIGVTAIITGGMRTHFLLDRFPDIDPSTLQDPRNVAEAIRFVLLQPPGTVIPEVTVLPVHESSWP
jgi:NAD(P)-dependent dehydrogenase (short-subunit alcohol dehydrogenase family)